MCAPLRCWLDLIVFPEADAPARAAPPNGVVLEMTRDGVEDRALAGGVLVQNAEVIMAGDHLHRRVATMSAQMVRVAESLIDPAPRLLPADEKAYLRT